MDDLDKEEEEKKSEHGIDLRPPADIIEEFIQTLVLLVERQHAAGPKVLRLMVLCLSLQNEGLADRALGQLLDFLDAGSIGEMVVATLMSTLIPQVLPPQPHPSPHRHRTIIPPSSHRHRTVTPR